MNKIILEKHTQTFIDELASKKGKPIYRMKPSEARALLEKIQSSTPAEKPSVKIEEKIISTGPTEKISLHIYRPANNHEKLPVILFFHGGGWVMGSMSTHDHLVRELAVGSHSAVVFVNYSRSPEAKYPTAIEEAYAATKYIAEHGNSLNLDTTRLAVVGDSVGGNMAIAVTLLAKERHGPKICYQVLFYPVISEALNTPSYKKFAKGPWLTKPAMQWFWKCYQPNIAARKKILLSPLNAKIPQLRGLPPALIITAENDVLRDEGERYASKLLQAGVQVTAARMIGTTHDFVMLHPLAKTPAVLGAIMLANTQLDKIFHEEARKNLGFKKEVA